MATSFAKSHPDQSTPINKPNVLRRKEVPIRRQPTMDSSVEKLPPYEESAPLGLTKRVASNETQHFVEPSLNSFEEELILAERTNNLHLETSLPPPTSPEFFSPNDSIGLVQSPTSLSSSVSSPDEPSRWKSAMGDVRHFAGGLIHHPAESTKHYSILRHSSGIVYYRGPSTRVTISIFSDRPLPPDRTLWIQRKGWTGKTGMRAKALLHTNNSWVNITPVDKADASQLPPTDERAWQRDIRKFLDKAGKDLRHHCLRETDILRIPAGVADGYFRIVLCAGQGSKSVLCPSPVFRLASTSTSASSIKGASLSTLPAEIGIKVVSTVAKTTASNAIAPFAGTVQAQVSQYMPSFWTQEAATTVYDASGVQGRIDNANAQYQQSRDLSFDPLGGSTLDTQGPPAVVGPESGPEPPFPITFNCKVVQGSGRSSAELGLPTANLASIPDDTIMRLSGVYFGWACINAKAQPTITRDWLQAIITVGPCPYAAPSVRPKKVVRAYFIHDFQGMQFFDAKISLVIMSFLRPMTKQTPDDQSDAGRDLWLYSFCTDVSIAQASLDRPEWGPDVTLERVKTSKSNRSMTERYVDMRQAGQRQVDRVPLHRVGIRTPGAGMQDRFWGNGGVYIPR